jgi:hypothetical protein
LNDTHRLFRQTTDAQIVNDFVSQNTIRVNDKSSPPRDARRFNERTILASDVLFSMPSTGSPKSPGKP